MSTLAPQSEPSAQNESDASPVERRPLEAIEATLETFRQSRPGAPTATESELTDEFCRAIVGQLQVTDEAYSQDVIAAALDSGRGERDREFVAGCLLRLMAVADELFVGGGIFAISAMRLLNDLRDATLYKDLGLRAEDQTYEKIRRLRSVVPDLEAEAKSALESFSNLSHAGTVHRKLMKLLNGRRSFPIRAFVSAEQIQNQMGALVANIEEYTSADGRDALACYDSAMSSLEDLTDSCNEIGTRYAREIFGAFAAKAQQHLEAHFSTGPNSESPDLVIGAGGKRYPFHVAGAQLRLSFTVSNKSAGSAYDVRLALDANADLTIVTGERFLGGVGPHDAIAVSFDAVVKSPMKSCPTILTVSWNNYDRSDHDLADEFTLQGQERHIAWDSLETEEPYSLEPVDSEQDLVGRDQIIHDLMRRTKAQSVGSSYLHGQKRVGKTSVARTLATMLREERSRERILVFLEAGQFSHPSGAATIKSLGEGICKAIAACDPRLAGLRIPVFEDALSPLVGLLDEARQIIPGLHILIVLDEFDELPAELCGQSEMAKAMFLTIRAISNDPHYGFIIVGGENLQYIINEQGSRLNKFKSVPLTYFDRRTQWSDFCSLVRRPVEAWLEISDAAIDALWMHTAGHPYYVKSICQQLFSLMVERRDGDVTETEVDEAAELLIQTLGGPAFQHFWEDAIAPDHPEYNEIRRLRKRIFLSLADYGKHPLAMEIDELADRVAQQDLSFTSKIAKDEIKDLCRREVLIDRDGTCSCKVPLFSEWLVAGGAKQILVTFSELTPGDEVLLREAENEITPQEVLRLLGRWGPYRGRQRTSDDVRGWLNQFGSTFNQRLMFTLLQSARFYSSALIRQKLREAHGIVTRDTSQTIEPRKLRRDIVVSYIGGVGKSGVQIARLYAEENGILQENVLERGKLANALRSLKDVKALVFVDDFVGTGGTVTKDFSSIAEDVGAARESEGLNMFFVAVAGFAGANSKLVRAANAVDLDITIHFCDVLDHSDRAFSEESKTFSDDQSRSLARRLAYDHGIRLVKNNPLGFAKGEALVVFESGCPNNSLPILWCASDDWVPLFPRVGQEGGS